MVDGKKEWPKKGGEGGSRVKQRERKKEREGKERRENRHSHTHVSFPYFFNLK